MFFQVQIETNEKDGKTGNSKQYFELDKTDITEIEDRIVAPFIRGDDIQFDGYFLSKKEIKRITIKETERTTEDLSTDENERMPSGIIMFISPSDIVDYKKYTNDITATVFDRVRASLASQSAAQAATQPDITTERKKLDNSKVFIVHGRDDLAKVSAARFIEKLGLSAIILHEQANAGKTIIEKIEEHTNAGFALVLYTHCDTGSLAGEPAKPRARQNVVFEHGFLIAKLGRRHVCALVKSGVEVPNDISGVVYIQLDEYGAWQLAVAKELLNAGYDIDMNMTV
jgi:predicted nucleotide-binding protein